jgi:hypothetical protein
MVAVFGMRALSGYIVVPVQYTNNHGYSGLAFFRLQFYLVAHGNGVGAGYFVNLENPLDACLPGLSAVVFGIVPASGRFINCGFNQRILLDGKDRLRFGLWLEQEQQRFGKHYLAIMHQSSNNFHALLAFIKSSDYVGK